MIPISRLIQLPTSSPIPWGYQYENRATILSFAVLSLPTSIAATRQDGVPYLLRPSQWEFDSTRSFCRLTLLEKDTAYAGRLLLNAAWARTDGTIEKSMLFRGIISPATPPLEQNPTASDAILVVNKLPANPSSSTLYILAATHDPYAVVEGALVKIGSSVQSSDEIAVQDDGTLEI